MAQAEVPPVPRAGLQVDPCFSWLTRAMQDEAGAIMDSGCYYVTPELCRELKHIRNGVAHIRLDHDLLDNDMWNGLCDTHATSRHKRDVTKILERAYNRLHGVRNRLEVKSIHRGMDNEVREDHHLAVQDLKAIQRDMGRLTHQSIGRIKQYCDQSGVTDLYTGFRNNLNTGNRDPLLQKFSWLDAADSPPFTNIRVRGIDDASYNQRLCDRDLTTFGSNARTARPPVDCAEHRKQPKETRSIQEQCGINTVFPGTTEYIDRYTFPERNKKITHYTINPLPDYNINGRKVDEPLYSCNYSEYQTSFVYPDAEKLPLFPWLRK